MEGDVKGPRTSKFYKESMVRLFKDTSSFNEEWGFTEAAMKEWQQVMARPGFRPYRKMLWDVQRETFVAVTDGFVTGKNAALNRGIDLRYGWDPTKEAVLGVVCFGRNAAWGEVADAEGRYGIHGGAMEAVLDEITAEAAKVFVVPKVLTASVEKVQLKMPMFAGDHCVVEARVTKSGVRIVTEGKLLKNNAVVAQGEFILANLEMMSK